MKILVTGHKGFIGQNFVNSIIEKHEVAGWEWNTEKLPDVKVLTGLYTWVQLVVPKKKMLTK